MTGRAPALVILQLDQLNALADTASRRCLSLAGLLEQNAAIDSALLPYMRSLATATELLVDQLPDIADPRIGKNVARLHNALDSHKTSSREKAA
jgi:hypothetical protein